MLHFNKIFDFEERLNALNSMRHEDAQAIIADMFDESRKAIALVGNTDTPLSF
jgi:hypothetical protein